MKICVFGAGKIGGTLGGKWAMRGHEVIFMVRDPQAEKVQTLLAEIRAGARAAAEPAALDGAGVVLFAIPGRAMPELMAQYGGHLNGKTLIDATNNIQSTPMHQLALLRETCPDSPLFRAFSNLGWENFAEPDFDGDQVALCYCGDDGPAQPVVDGLIGQIGLRPIYIGGLQQADLIDAQTRLWFVLAMQRGYGRHTAFKLLTDSR